MVMGILNRVKRRIKGEDSYSGDCLASEASTVSPLSSMLGPSGRITLASLKWLFKESGRDDFIEFVRNPVLAGSALNSENITAAEHSEEDAAEKSQALKGNKTHLVNMDEQLYKRSGPGSSLPYAIYPFIKRSNSKSRAHMLTIGRTPDNDMIMKDMAISKAHAAIRIAKGSFFIEDCGSTNGTRLNGVRVGDKPVMLRDRDVIALGSYEFTFLYPASLHDLLGKF